MFNPVFASSSFLFAVIVICSVNLVFGVILSICSVLDLPS